LCGIILNRLSRQKLIPFLNPDKKQKLSISILSNKENNVHSPQDLVNAFSAFFATILNKFEFFSIDKCKNYVSDFFERTLSLKNLIKSDIIKFEFGSTNVILVKDSLKKLNAKSALVQLISRQESLKIAPPKSMHPRLHIYSICVSKLVKYQTNGRFHILPPIIKVKGITHRSTITAQSQLFHHSLKSSNRF
jgi:hypothetical protein